MSRLLLTGLMAASVMITGCQQQKLGSEPQPAAQPRATNPPPSNNPPPRGPGPGPGTVNRPPPATPPPPGYGPGPGPGPGSGYPPPPPNGPGPGPGTNYPPPPPNGPGPGPGNNYPPPPPTYNPPGPTYGPGPGTNNPPPPRTTDPTDPVYPPYTPNEPPTTYPPYTPPTTTTPTGTPPTTVTPPPPTTYNPPPQQPPPPTQQPPTQQPPVQQPVVPSVNLPPSTFPTQPQQCNGLGCGNQQIIPPPAPPQQPPVAQPPQRPVAPPIAQKPVAPPVQGNGPGNGAPFTVGEDPVAPTQPAVVTPSPVVEQPPVVTGPKQECRDIPLNMELSTTKLDVLFVLDTSASMRDGNRKGMTGELAMIAKQMASFARNLDDKTDFRIGLLLGHGPEDAKHPGYKHGSLFQVNSSDPAVIDFQKMLKACGSGKNARECAYGKVVQALEKKMHALPIDHSDAQGEALMLSLYDATATESSRLAIKKQGLFREDAVLSIIPISDEQDVCYDYEKCTINEGESEAAKDLRCKPAQVKLRDAKGKLIGTTGQDPHETKFFDKYCKRAVDNGPLTPENVLTALVNMKGDIRKVAITPIIYLDNSKPVREQDENEMGHGYIELAQFGKGMVADLNSAHLAKGESNFEPILKNFGTFIDTKMKIQPPFLCSSDMNPDAVDLRTMDIHILDQNGKDLELFSPKCTGEACAGSFRANLDTDGNGKTTHMTVDLDAMKLYKALQTRGFKNGKVHIKFKNRSDFDAQGNRTKRMVFRPKRKAKTEHAAAPAQTPHVVGAEEVQNDGSGL